MTVLLYQTRMFVRILWKNRRQQPIDSRKRYEEDVQVTGFGLMLVKSEGASLSYDSEVHFQRPLWLIIAVSIRLYINSKLISA